MLAGCWEGGNLYGGVRLGWKELEDPGDNGSCLA